MGGKDISLGGYDLVPSERMPVLFLGHGNPMNAITPNPFRPVWERLGKELPRPQAILCVSAHWLTRGTYVAMSEHPSTIHDFGGFPEELYAQQYPAPGAPGFAKETIAAVRTAEVRPDYEWGLDHGAWCVLQSMYPAADVPVFQMSIDYGQPPRYHVELGQQLAPLRDRGVLILSSGNVVHNLRALRPGAAPPDWAVAFDSFVKESVLANNLDALVGYRELDAAAMAVPTNDHYLPLLYTMAARSKKDEASFFAEEFDLGSISMRCVLLG